MAEAGSAKQDPKTKAVAVKLPAGSPLGDYGVMTLTAGGYFASEAEVADWADLS